MAYYQVGGARLHYEDVGSGAPLLLIHGAVASGRQFNDVVPFLAKRFRVVIPDLRGMGKSDRTPYLPARTWQDDLLGLLDELRIEQAHVAGTSLGARVATRIALDAPERVTTLVVDAPILRNEPAGDAALTHLLGPDMPAHFAASVADWQGEGWREVVETYRTARSDSGFQTHYSTAAEVSHLRMPVFITRGDTDDAMHPISHATQLHAACARSVLWIAPRTGFSAMRFRAAHFAELLGEFIGAESIK